MKIAIGRPALSGPVCGGLLSSWEAQMCEAKVYVSRDGEEQKVMEDVVLVQPEGDAYLLVSLLGEQKLVQGRIEKIDFLRHALYLGRLQGLTADGG
jgi:predicted RNA-binding protein